MDEVAEFFEHLFAVDHWPPRWQCGQWTDFHGWLYIASDLMIWFAYFIIPLIILNYFSAKSRSINFRRVYILFAAFILLCGMTHLMDVLMFWTPMYRLNALIRFVTGVVSLFTAYYLFRILPEFFQQKTNLELKSEILRRMEAEDRLAEANQNLKSFAYMASHDLQEPLRKIRLFLERISGEEESAKSQQSQTYILKATNAAERLQTLITDILKLSTIVEAVELEPVDPKKAVFAAMENLELSIKETGAIIEMGELPLIKGYLPYLTQLFTNLIANSIKFNEKVPHVRITAEKSGEKVSIMVSDNGIGIDVENANLVFEAFHRVRQKNEYQGSGIGLAIVKKIIQVHQAEISVNSRPGEGTTFNMLFLVP